ncbi:MAG: hypothetical protein Q8R47_01860 [Nanoarchaeota archaeon]|nr:hypothetical protein [Nanoarchaeota archaeon]
MIDTIKGLRKVIRYHRDQKGDDRCWVDDHLVWNSLPETKQVVKLPTYDEGMRRCRAFFKYRNANSVDEISAAAVLDPAKWDNDLAGMNPGELTHEFSTLENAIRKHSYIVYRERTAEDDRELYSVLPEKIPADFRLPCEEDFLGTTRTDAGCPQFWKSHEHCPGTHNLHQWGPCKK